MSTEQIDDVMQGLRYEDDTVDNEMREYLNQIIACITTGDEVEDFKSIDTFAATIAA